jgi:four helix bundle protein
MAFSYAKLEVYQEHLLYLNWLGHVLLLHLKGVDTATANQISRAAKSIGANLAEGTGQWLPGNKVRYYRYAHGSASECAAHMDTLKAMGTVDPETLEGWKEAIERINRIGVWVHNLVKKTEARAEGQQRSRRPPSERY